MVNPLLMNLAWAWRVLFRVHCYDRSSSPAGAGLVRDAIMVDAGTSAVFARNQGQLRGHVARQAPIRKGRIPRRTCRENPELFQKGAGLRP